MHPEGMMWVYKGVNASVSRYKQSSRIAGPAFLGKKRLRQSGTAAEELESLV